MSIDNLETFLEKNIEGFFNRKLSSTLEFAEIIKQLEREIIHNKEKTKTGCVVPNVYYIAMSPEDYQRMCVKRFMDTLYVLAEKTVIKNDCYMDNKLQITLQRHPNIKKGVCKLWSRFEENAEDSGESTENSEDVGGNTLIMDREDMDNGPDGREELKTVSLLAMEGPDIDSYLEFGERQIYIGRKGHNDFILTDTNASRLHAVITYERHRHYISDADSLNGTFLNGMELKHAHILKNGDEIQIGETVLLYEVI